MNLKFKQNIQNIFEKIKIKVKNTLNKDVITENFFFKYGIFTYIISINIY